MPSLPHRLTSAANPRRRLPRWSLTLLTALSAVLLRSLLQPVLGDQQPFLIACPAVVLAAALWGILPGVVVALVCMAAVMLPWVSPAIAVGQQPQQVGAFAIVAIFLCLVCNLRVQPAGERGEQELETPLTAWLRAVLWGSLLVPLTAFVAASWWGYEHAVEEPRCWCAATRSAPSTSRATSRAAPTRPRPGTTPRSTRARSRCTSAWPTWSRACRLW
jgi:hypothetical protein